MDIKKHKKTDFDFFRYLPNHPHQQNQEYRRGLRLKFRVNLRRIARNLINQTQRMTETLLIVQQICKDRKAREEQLKMLMFKNDQYA